MSLKARIRLFLVSMFFLLYGCQTVYQNLPAILLPSPVPSAREEVQDIHAFAFTEDFFLAAEYLPERRLCYIAPEDTLTELVILLNEQNNSLEQSSLFSLVRNKQVDHYLQYYQARERQDFSASLEKSTAYLPYIYEVLDSENIPRELAYLALIESDFNSRAYSKHNAAGMWQFMRSTARRCGLRIDRWVDERLDFEKSTQAAACYLKQLYKEFGSWHLAVAAYNAGEVNIRNALCKNGSKEFWDINKRKHLKRETINFVPQLIATVIIAQNPRAYGFTSLNYRTPVTYDTVSVDTATDLKVVAQYCGSSMSEIKQLNPALKRNCTPPDYADYPLHIPKGTTERFQIAGAEHSPASQAARAQHTIKKGETFKQIARRYGISEKALLAHNEIKNPHTLREGDTLLIPSDAGAAPHAAQRDESQTGERNASGAGTETAEEDGFKKVIYRVAPGDTLWGIARSYNLHPDHIKKWNNLRGDRIHPGIELKLLLKKDKMI